MSTNRLIQARRALQLLLGKQRLRSPAQQAAITRARKRAASWLASPYIVGIGVGHRSTKGVTQTEPAILVHVKEKLPVEKMTHVPIPPAIRLPGIPGAVAVDVVTGSTISVHTAYCGDAIAAAGSLDWGTLGCMIVAPEISSDSLMLTCAHVIDGVPAVSVDGLGYPGDTNNSRNHVGKLVLRELPIPSQPNDPWPNLYEIALVMPLGEVKEAHPGGVAPIGIRKEDAEQGEQIVLFGAKSGRLEGRISEVDYNGYVETSNGVFGFSGLMLYDAPALPGDSGAAILDLQRRIVGIHLGALENGRAVMMPIGPIARRYRLRLPEKDVMPSSAPLMHDDRAQAIDVLARTIWGEARGQPIEGQEAVANVVMNRVRKRRKAWGLTVESVCKAPKQFSCWNANDPNLPKLKKVDASNIAFSACLDIARRAVNGDLGDRTFCSTHYHTSNVRPNWSVNHTHVVQIGSHLFFNNIP